MHIPPYYRKPSWQRFFSGMVVGAGLSWCIFLYMHGVMLEEKSAEISKLSSELKDEKNKVKIWQDDYKALNKKSLEQLTIQDIKVKITNGAKYDLDTLAVLQVEEEIREDLTYFIAKDLEFVYKSRDLITKIIKNKVIKAANGKRYRLRIKSTVVYTTVNLELELQLDD